MEAAEPQSETLDPGGLFETFRTRAEAVGAKVVRLATVAGALEFIFRTLATEEVSSAAGSHAVWAPCPFLGRIDREDVTRFRWIRLDVTRALAAGARVGISQVELAIADTGSLVVASPGIEQRLVSTLPIAHIAIVATRTLVADLSSALERLPPKDHPYFSLITGPSRTADIERVLTIGVHGPERLHIGFVDDL